MVLPYREHDLPKMGTDSHPDEYISDYLPTGCFASALYSESPKNSTDHHAPLNSSARTPRGDCYVAGPSHTDSPTTPDDSPDIWYDVTTGFDRYSSYAPIIVQKDLPCCSTRSSSCQYIRQPNEYTRMDI